MSSNCISISCSAPAPASKGLEALVKILALNDCLVTSSRSPMVTVTTKHLLGSEDTSVSGTTWMGCARLLCHQVPMSGLWGNENLEKSSLVEAWMESATMTLVPILLGGKKDAIFTLSLNNYATKLNDCLSSSASSKYLVGDTPTAADICISIWLMQACSILSLPSLPEKTSQWCKTFSEYSILKEFYVTKAVDSAAVSTEIPDLATTTTTAPSPPSELGDNFIVSKLKEYQLEFSSYTHTPCMTAEELVTNVPIVNENESHTKNLFLRDKKHGLFLLSLLPSTIVNTKDLGKMLQLKGKTNLRMADAKLLKEHLGAEPGCVGPLAITNDTSGKVTIVLDAALLAKSKIHSHPLCNDASIILTPSILKEYIAKTDHQPVILEFEGGDVGVGTAPSVPKPPKQPKQEEKKTKQKQQHHVKKASSKKGETLLALQWTKEDDFPHWYTDVITLSEMISYYDISGCYILRPWSYKMWELIQEWFNVELRKLDVENSYFPLFVTQERLEKEKDHVEGFAPEVAWVTKSGDSDLAKPIAVRPTSETIMYPAFSNWIKSHRDLPLKLNQWSNVVRWEFKDPTPFLRSREFLWQEGHTAHANFQDADVMVRQALELYRKVYEELLAVPVVPGYKTKAERFAGGVQTTTVEAYVPIAGRAIQGATSHNLGQNFGKMFDITFQDRDGKVATAWQTSWGLTTRTIGVMVMVHGDNIGLVLPPRMAPIQAVIVPIVSKKVTMDEVSPYCQIILEDLLKAGIRAKFDDRTMYNPGWKYNHWEQKGVPVRIEVGPRDIEQKQARIVVRYSGAKIDMPVENLGNVLVTKMEEIQEGLFQKAKTYRDDHLVQVTEWKKFVPELEKHNLVLTPWCGGEHEDWEEWVKNKSREESLAARGEEEEDARTATSVAAKTLCIPFAQPDLPAGTKCIASGMDATCWVLWGRSY